MTKGSKLDKALVTFKFKSSLNSAIGVLTFDLCFLWLSLRYATYARSGLLRWRFAAGKQPLKEMSSYKLV